MTLRQICSRCPSCHSHRFRMSVAWGRRPIEIPPAEERADRVDDLAEHRLRPSLVCPLGLGVRHEPSSLRHVRAINPAASIWSCPAKLASSALQASPDHSRSRISVRSVARRDPLDHQVVAGDAVPLKVAVASVVRNMPRWPGAIPVHDLHRRGCVPDAGDARVVHQVGGRRGPGLCTRCDLGTDAGNVLPRVPSSGMVKCADSGRPGKLRNHRQQHWHDALWPL